MKEEKEVQAEENLPVETRKIWFWFGVALTVVAAVAFGLTFSILGIFALISSVVLSLAALAFLRTQKKRNNFKAVFIATVCAYVVLGISVAFFIGGLIYSAV